MFTLPSLYVPFSFTLSFVFMLPFFISMKQQLSVWYISPLMCYISWENLPVAGFVSVLC
jgi:hypothetical protein